jgi:hypothetical protein
LVRFLTNNKIAFSKKYLFLLPSVIFSITYLIYIVIYVVNYTYSSGMAILISLVPICSPALLFYYLSGNYKLYLSAILCFIFPCSIVISMTIFSYFWGI